jgi:AcrR family transcriptional regulator
MTRRAYDNTFRAEMAEQTRVRILRAAVDLLGEAQDTPLTMALVAARAGVSEPTAYRHFPSREALLEAIAVQASKEFGEPPMADDVEDLPALMVAVSDYFGRHAAWMRSTLKNPRSAEVRATGRRHRAARLRAVVEPRLSHLRARERDLVMAIVQALVRLESWDHATRQLGLTSDEAGRALAWAMRALLDAVDRDRREGRTTLIDADVVERGRRWGERDATKTPARAEPRTARRGRGR